MLKSMLDGSHSLSANIIFFGTLCWQVHIPTWPISLRHSSLLSTFYLYVLYLEAITYLESCHIDNVINEVSMLHKWWGTMPRKPPILLSKWLKSYPTRKRNYELIIVNLLIPVSFSVFAIASCNHGFLFGLQIIFVSVCNLIDRSVWTFQIVAWCRLCFGCYIFFFRFWWLHTL